MGYRARRTAGELAEVHRRLVHVWDTDPEITVTALGERFRLSNSAINDILRKAFEEGQTQRSTVPVREPTRTRKQGRL